MKRFLIIISSVVLLLCGCSPKVVNSTANSYPESHPDYAVVYLYRKSGYVQTSYDVYLNDNVVYRSKNKTKKAIRIDKPGRYEIWGKTESKETLTLDVEMGKDYYVRTFVHMGVAIWRPSIEVVTPEQGKSDWASIK